MTDPYWSPDLGSTISASFTYDVGDHGWGNQELQMYTTSPSNAFIDADGKSIVIRAVADVDDVGAERYTSARLVSKASLAKERGYLEACIRPPFAKGIWFAFWLLPKKPFDWPGDGEIDICEGWSGKRENGTCLHWGHFNEQDGEKHRVLTLPVAGEEHRYGFAWECATQRLVWFTDGQPTMRAKMPTGTRSMTEFQIVLNVAMGGNVMQGERPDMPSQHEMSISEMAMFREPPARWGQFDSTWERAREGRPM